MFRLTAASTLLLVAFAHTAVAQEDPTTRSSNTGAPTSAAPAGPVAPPESALPASRAVVKDETRAAEKSGAIARGQASTPDVPGDRPKSVVSKAEVKREAAKAEAHREPIYGLTSQWNQMNAGKSTANRAEVKATTKSAEKSGQIPRGEASPAPAGGPAAY